MTFCKCKNYEVQKNPSECIPYEAITSQDTTFEIYSPGKMKYGYANAIKLNKPWTASAQANFYKDTFYISFDTYYISPKTPDYEYHTEYLEIKIANLNESCMILSRLTTHNSCRMIYAALADDANENFYSLIESDPNNYIQFDTLNIETGRVAGKFIASFERDQSWVKKPWNPDFVRFFNGEFHCRIKN